MVRDAEVTYRVDDGIAFLDFPRDVTAQTRGPAYRAYHALDHAAVRTLALNFAASDYLNSAGIGLVISLVEDGLQAGHQIYGVGLSAHYSKLFGMVGLTENMKLVQSEQDVHGAGG